MKMHAPQYKFQSYKKMKVRRQRSDNIMQGIIVIILLLLCASIILPCLNILALAFNDGSDAAKGGVYFFPRMFTLQNFKEVFKDGKIIGAYRITVARTIIGTVLSLWLITMSAFVLKIKTLPGRTFFTMAIALTMLFSGGLIPTYIQYKNLGLSRSYRRLLFVYGSYFFRYHTRQFGRIGKNRRLRLFRYLRENYLTAEQAGYCGYRFIYGG